MDSTTESTTKTKASTIVFDIETYSTHDPKLIEEIRDEAVKKRPANNTLKAKKIEWDTTEERAKRGAEAVAKTALDPMLASVLVVAWQADDEIHYTDVFLNGQEEAEGLHNLAMQWDEQAGPETLWVGHNICGFDLPVLLGAWNRHDIEPPDYFPRFYRGRWSGRIYDSMEQVPNNRAGFVSLDTVCRALNLPTAKSVLWKGEPMDGSRVAEAFEAGETDLLQDYCIADVQAEARVFQRLTHGGRYGVGPRDKGVREALAEIWQSELSRDAKKIASFDALHGLGVIPAGVVA